MKKHVTVRQTCLILTLVAITTKLLFLPSLLSQEVGRDAYLYVVFFMLLEIGVFFIFFFLSNKFPDLNFKQLMDKLFGKIFSRFILFLYFIYFLFQTSIVFQSAYVYLYENLYSELKWYVYAFPLFFTMGYVAIKGLNSIARLIEVFFPIIAGGVLISFFLGLINSNLTNVLPVLENNVGTGVLNVSKYALWFSDYLIFVVLFGQIKTEPKQTKKYLITMVASTIFVAAFVMVFYCLYHHSAIFHKNAITDVMQVIPRNSDIGSLDWVISLIWDCAMIIFMCLMFFASIQTCKYTFSINHDWINILITLALIFIIVFFLKFDISHIVEYVTMYLRYYYYVVIYLIPLLMLIIGLFKHKEENTDG